MILALVAVKEHLQGPDLNLPNRY